VGDAAPTDLRVMIEQRSTIAATAELDRLITELRRRHGETVQAVLFYGSCLRSGNLYDGLVDLYLIVDGYRTFYRAWLRAFANWLLPPNVFYLQIGDGHQVLRAKYAVVSARDFARGTSPRWFHSYLWGRFTQPVALAYARDTAAGAHVLDCLTHSIVTFLDRVLPRVADSGTLRALWVEGLQLSYHAELRAESGDRTRELVEHHADYYAAVTRAAQPHLRDELRIVPAASGATYRTRIGAPRRAVARIAWPVRQAQGKLLSLLRLFKALFTFEGGLDYIAWKLERHSGQTVTIPARVRRYPLIFVWGLAWQLYRRGVFR